MAEIPKPKRPIYNPENILGLSSEALKNIRKQANLNRITEATENSYSDYTPVSSVNDDILSSRNKTDEVIQDIKFKDAANKMVNIGLNAYNVQQMVMNHKKAMDNYFANPNAQVENDEARSKTLLDAGYNVQTDKPLQEQYESIKSGLPENKAKLLDMALIYNDMLDRGKKEELPSGWEGFKKKLRDIEDAIPLGKYSPTVLRAFNLITDEPQFNFKDSYLKSFIDRTGQSPDYFIPRRQPGETVSYSADAKNDLDNIVKGIKGHYDGVDSSVTENLTQKFIEGVTSSFVTPYGKRIIDYVPEREKNEISRINAIGKSIGLTENSIFPTREESELEKIGGGVAQLLGMAPAFIRGRGMGSQMAPEIYDIKTPENLAQMWKTGEIPVTQKLVTTGEELAKKITSTGLTFELTNLPETKDKEVGKSFQSGTGFGLSEALTEALGTMLPSGKYMKYAKPIVNAFLTGTSFSAGSYLSAKLNNQDVNLLEEFGKGVGLSVVHTISKGFSKTASDFIRAKELEDNYTKDRYTGKYMGPDSGEGIVKAPETRTVKISRIEPSDIADLKREIDKNPSNDKISFTVNKLAEIQNKKEITTQDAAIIQKSITRLNKEFGLVKVDSTDNKAPISEFLTKGELNTRFSDLKPMKPDYIKAYRFLNMYDTYISDKQKDELQNLKNKDTVTQKDTGLEFAVLRQTPEGKIILASVDNPKLIIRTEKEQYLRDFRTNKGEIKQETKEPPKQDEPPSNGETPPSEGEKTVPPKTEPPPARTENVPEEPPLPKVEKNPEDAETNFQNALSVLGIDESNDTPNETSKDIEKQDNKPVGENTNVSTNEPAPEPKTDFSKLEKDINKQTKKAATIKELPDFPAETGYRYESNYTHSKGTTAYDVVHFEKTELGNSNNVSAKVKKELKKSSAKDLVWVTLKEEDAAVYKPEHDTEGLINQVVIPKGSKIVGGDEQGGYLVLLKKTKQKKNISQTKPDESWQTTSKGQKSPKVQKEPEEAAKPSLKPSNKTGAEESAPASPKEEREKGYKLIEGKKIERKGEIADKVSGKDVKIQFAKNKNVPGKWVVTDVNNLEGSHYKGKENPNYFIPDSQPRRRDTLSSLKNADDKKADELATGKQNPEILGYSTNAYFGSSVATKNHGEVFQGNGRLGALRRYYEKYPDDPAGMKQFYKDNAAMFGLKPEDIDKYKQPYVYREADVTDDEAIQLGQYDVKDLEDVSTSSTKGVQALRKINAEDLGKLSEYLQYKTDDEDLTLKTIIRENGKELFDVLQKLGAVRSDAVESYFDKNTKGLTEEGGDLLYDIIKGMLFIDGDAKLPELYKHVPSGIRKGIETSLGTIISLTDDKSIIPLVQRAIIGLYDYTQYLNSVKGTSDFDGWAFRQESLEGPVTDRYTPEELMMIYSLISLNENKILKQSKTKVGQYNIFFKMLKENINGYEDMFEKKEPMTQAESFNNIFEKEYGKEQKYLTDKLRQNALGIPEEGGRGKESGANQEKQTDNSQSDKQNDSGTSGPEVNSKTEPDELNDAWNDFINAGNGKLYSIGIDPEVLAAGMKVVKLLLKKGLYKLRDILKAAYEKLGEEMYKKFFPAIKSVYTSMYAEVDDAMLEKMDDIKTVRGITLENSLDNIKKELLNSNKEKDNARSTGDNMEPNSSRKPVENGVGEKNIPDESGTNESGTKQGTDGNSEKGVSEQSGTGVRPGVSAPGGKGSDTGDNKPKSLGGPETNAAGPGNPAGSLIDNREGIQLKPDGEIIVNRTPEEESTPELKQLTKEEKISLQKKAETISNKTGDLENIKSTLPYLLPSQHEDVHKAEKRFFGDEHQTPDNLYGKGILFTNQTGTGKTYVGLGIAKRFHKDGKKSILILVPTDIKAKDWAEDGRNLLLDIHQLKDTQDNGPGKDIIVTTYANFRANDNLMNRDFDLIIDDEAHNIISNEAGSSTSADRMHKRIALSPYYALQKARGDIQYETRLNEINKKYENEDIQDPRRKEEVAALTKEAYDKALELFKATKVVFLSATPFAYHKTLEYADGFLFPINEDVNYGAREEGYSGYNQGNKADRFYMQNFGYRMRYNKLTLPERGIDVGLMERNFTDNLIKKGVTSSRLIDVDKDYSRHFIQVDSETGNLIDDGLRIIHEEKMGDEYKWKLISPIFNKKFNYLYTSQLIEAIKARKIIDRINEHLALGRKVLVYHSYNNSLPSHPFEISNEDILKASEDLRGVKMSDIRMQLADFHASHPEFINLDLKGLSNPIETLSAAFPEIATFFNGMVPKKKRTNNKVEFNKKGGKYKILVTQLDAGKEGLDAHDIYGDEQRVILCLGLPIKPTVSIQMEGRIYRYGVKSNAIIEYVTLGNSFERFIYSGKIKERVKTAENLALGSQARDLETAFREGYINAVTLAPGDWQGTGGKELDKLIESINEFDKAKTYYIARGKRSSKDKSKEGTDYFATPEPLGFKMVEWMVPIANKSYMEPSAGHGAIARFFPNDTDNDFIEPSRELASQLSVNATSGKVKMINFEDLHIMNKYHGIAMNPPFGKAGKQALEHIDKAFKHLYLHGRIVAIAPVGSFDSKFEKWLENNPTAVLRGRILLPSVTFERAGTSVNAQVLIIDRAYTPDKDKGLDDLYNDWENVNKDFRDAQTISELFDRIENIEAPKLLDEYQKPKEDKPHQNQSIYSHPGSFLKSGSSDEVAVNTAYSSDNSEVVESKHTKYGYTIHTVKLLTRLSENQFRIAKEYAKSLNGYWSSYKGNNAIPGFIFKEKDNARTFSDFINNLGDSDKPDFVADSDFNYKDLPPGDKINLLRALEERHKFIEKRLESVQGNGNKSVLRIAIPEQMSIFDMDNPYENVKYEDLVVDENEVKRDKYRQELSIIDTELKRLNAEIAADKKAGVTYDEVGTRSMFLEDKPSEPFYSQLGKVAAEKIQNNATPEQVKATLLNNGVKQAEYDWLGLDEWLKGKEKISKDELMKFINENQVKVETVIRGEKQYSKLEDLPEKVREIVEVYNNRTSEKDYDLSDFLDDLDSLGYAADYDMHDETIQAIYEKGKLPTKFAEWTLYGGTNYREVLLTIPAEEFKKQKELEFWQETHDNAQRKFESYRDELAIKYGVIINAGTSKELLTKDEYGKYTELKKTVTDLMERFNELKTERADTNKKNFQSRHFDEQNIALHLRIQDLNNIEGKNILLIDELQSDWAQKGRKEGYSNPQKEKVLKNEWENINKDIIEIAKSVQKRMGLNNIADARIRLMQDSKLPEFIRYSELTERKSEIEQKQRGGLVPDMPFKKNWHEVGMKFALRYAAENGYDGLAWTHGSIQADRYNLSKQVDYINSFRKKDGTYNLNPFKDEKQWVDPRFQNIPENKLADVIGKDLAEKIINSPKDINHWRESDLKIGGEGMKGFYDKILPDFMSKYTKKWGGKVEDIELPKSALSKVILEGRDKNEEGREEFINKLHFVPVTDSMKKDVLKGQALFDAADIFPPEIILPPEYKNKVVNAVNELANIEKNYELAKNKLTGKVETVGVNFTRSLINKKVVDFRGVTLKDSGDIGLITQVLRNPLFESFTIFYLKGNQIIFHESISSGLVDKAVIAEFGKGLDGNIQRIKRLIKSLGADEIVFQHNHPSGSPQPSEMDIDATLKYAENIPQLKKHVVINSGKYAIIEINKGKANTTLKNLTKEDLLMKPGIKNPVLGTKVTDNKIIAGLTKSIQLDKNQVAIYYLSSRKEIKGVQIASGTIFRDFDRAMEYLRAAKRYFGSIYASVGGLHTLPDDVKDALTGLVYRNELEDFTVNTPTGIISTSEMLTDATRDTGEYLANRIVNRRIIELPGKAKYLTINDAVRQTAEYLQFSSEGLGLSRKLVKSWMMRNGIDVPPTSRMELQYALFDEPAQEPAPLINTDEEGFITNDSFKEANKVLQAVAAYIKLKSPRIDLPEFTKKANDLFSRAKIPFKLTDTQAEKLFGIGQKVVDNIDKIVDRPPIEKGKKKRKFIEQVDASDDIEMTVKRRIKDYSYTPISNKETVARAKKMINEFGVNGTIERLDKWDSGYTATERIAASFILIKSLSEQGKKYRDAGKDKLADDAFNLSAEVVDISARLGTQTGQGTQIYNVFKFLSPEGSVNYAKRTLNRIEHKKIQSLYEWANILNKEWGKINKEVSDGIIQDLKDRILELEALLKAGKSEGSKRKKKPPRDISKMSPDEIKRMEEEEIIDSVAEKVARIVKNRVKPPTPDELKLLINRLVKTLVNISDENNLIPPKVEMIKREVLKDIAEGMNMTTSMEKGWDLSKEYLKDHFAGDDDSLSVLQEFFDYYLENPFSNKQVDKVINEQIKEDEINLTELVKKHYTVVDYTGMSLREKILNKLGSEITPSELILKKIANLEKSLKTKFEEKTAARKEAILKRMMKNPFNRKQKSILRQILELTNLGALDEDTYLPIIKKKMKVKELTGAEIETIHKYADEIQTLPEGSIQMEKAAAKMLNYIASLRGFKLSELAMETFYGAVLLGIQTSLKNTTFNAIELAIAFLLRNPLNYGQALKGIIDMGLPKGLVDMAYIYKEGDFEGEGKWENSYKLHSQRISEIIKQLNENTEKSKKNKTSIGIFNFSVPVKTKNLSLALALARFSGRNMAAQDRLFYWMSNEMEKRCTAYQLAKDEGLRGKQLSARVEQMLHNSDADIENARIQATEEGLKKNSLEWNKRIFQIVDSHIDENIKDWAGRFASFHTLNYEPRGVGGSIYRSIVKFQSDPNGRASKYLLPFIRISTNLGNEFINWSPYGFKRAFYGYGYGGGRERLEGREYDIHLYRAIIGTLGMGALYFLVKKLLESDDDTFDITANGTGNWDKNKQLSYAEKWKEYTVKIGNRRIGYMNTPFFLPLLVAGYVMDGYKYRKDKIEDESNLKIISGLVAQTISGFTKQSMLSGFLDFVSIFDENNPDKAEKWFGRFLTRTASSIITPRFIPQIIQMFDDKEYTADNFAEMFLRNIGVAGFVGMKPALNPLAQEIHKDGILFPVKVEKDHVWEFLVKNSAFISTPKPGETMYDPNIQEERILSPDEFYNYIKISGTKIYKALDNSLTELSNVEDKELVKLLVKELVETQRYYAKQEIAGLGDKMDRKSTDIFKTPDNFSNYVKLRDIEKKKEKLLEDYAEEKDNQKIMEMEIRGRSLEKQHEIIDGILKSIPAYKELKDSMKQDTKEEKEMKARLFGSKTTSGKWW